ncbi:MAG: hypothetical protein GX658_08230 [Clostridiales bacterium]|nr:hypothetical protein [Clostridiales bacterium]
MTEFESSAFKDYRHISLRWNNGGFLTEEESTAFKNYRHISLSWNSGGLSAKSREHRL